MKRRYWHRTGIWEESDGKLGRIYSYWNYRRKRQVYISVLSPYAARINEHLALQRARPITEVYAYNDYTKRMIRILNTPTTVEWKEG